MDFNLGSSFSFLLSEFKPGFKLEFEFLEEFELFQGSENSILNVLFNLGSTWVESRLNLD